MHPFEMRELALDYELRHAVHGVRDVREHSSLLAIIEKVEKGAGLTVIVISVAMVVTIGISTDLQRRLGKFRTLDGSVERVRFVICIRVRIVCEESHLSVLVIVMHRTFGSVHRQGLVVSAEAMAMRVRIREDASLQ